MLNKLLDHCFGNKVKFVRARKLQCFMEFEQNFIFHKDATHDFIEKFLWITLSYSIEEIKCKRDKKIISPKSTHFRIIGKEKCVKWYFD